MAAPRACHQCAGQRRPGSCRFFALLCRSPPRIPLPTPPRCDGRTGKKSVFSTSDAQPLGVVDVLMTFGIVRKFAELPIAAFFIEIGRLESPSLQPNTHAATRHGDAFCLFHQGGSDALLAT